METASKMPRAPKRWRKRSKRRAWLVGRSLEGGRSWSLTIRRTKSSPTRSRGTGRVAVGALDIGACRRISRRKSRCWGRCWRSLGCTSVWRGCSRRTTSWIHVTGRFSRRWWRCSIDLRRSTRSRWRRNCRCRDGCRRQGGIRISTSWCTSCQRRLGRSIMRGSCSGRRPIET